MAGNLKKPRGTGRPNCTKDQEEDPCQVKVTGPAEAVSWPVIADPDVLGGIVSFRTLRPYSVAIFPYIALKIAYIYIYGREWQGPLICSFGGLNRPSLEARIHINCSMHGYHVF